MRSDTLCVVCISMGPQHSTAVQYCIHIIEPQSAPPTGSRVIWHIGTVPEKENPTFILYIMSKFPVNLSTVIWEFMRKLTGELVIQGFS